MKQASVTSEHRSVPGSDARPEILYVEDELAIFEVVELLLAPRFALVRAADARQAFELLREWGDRLVAILLDIQLQGSELDGIEIAHVLRGRHLSALPAYARGQVRRGLPIIFVTANAGLVGGADLPSLGAVDLVPKPVDARRLEQALRRALDGR